MRAERKHVISIAGFDPSAGAGILADVKTFEQLGVYGFGVCTAITLQTEDEFKGVAWIPLHQIELQLDTLMKKYEIEFFKIGLIQSLEVLDQLIETIKRKYPRAKIIWDPILKSSSGFQFHSVMEENLLREILSQIYLVTPNAEEVKLMMGGTDSFQAAKALSRLCNVFLKSFFDAEGNHYDIIFEQPHFHSFSKKEIYLRTEVITDVQKHGSGCVLSAAVTASLAKGHDLQSSCEEAKTYTREFLRSSEGLLGEHHSITSISQHA